MTSGFHVQEHPCLQSLSTALAAVVSLCLSLYLCVMHLYLGVWGPRVCLPVRLFVPTSVGLSLCTPASHGGRNRGLCEGVGDSFSTDLLCHGSKRSWDQILTSFWNQEMSELEQTWVEMGKIGCLLWEGRGAVGKEKVLELCHPHSSH